MDPLYPLSPQQQNTATDDAPMPLIIHSHATNIRQRGAQLRREWNS